MTMIDPLAAVGIRLEGRRVVFAGAGAVAERKLSRLLNSGAQIVVVAPDATPEIQRLAADGKLAWEARPAAPDDFAGALLAFIATNDPEASAALADAARSRGALVNRADDAEDCDFVLPALAWMNTINIGVFSGSPTLSKWVRRYLEQTLGPEFPEFAAAFAEIRARIRAMDLPQQTRADILSRLLNEGLYDLYRTSGMKAVLARVDTLIGEYK